MGSNEDDSQAESERWLGKVFDEMLTSAEINIYNRPFVQGLDSLGNRISLLVIPTLEDLKAVLFVAGNLVENSGYPSKITTVEDIVTAARMAGENAFASHDSVSALVSHLTKMLSYRLELFKKECNSHGGTTKILDADGLSELSSDRLLQKYFP